MSFKDMHAEEIRDTWQARVLREADPRENRVLLAAIVAEDQEGFKLLLAAMNVRDIRNPVYAGRGFIADTGRVVANLSMRASDGVRWHANKEVYDSEDSMIYEFRKLADRLKLSDADRIDMFRVLKKWVTKDERLDIRGEKTNVA